MMISLLDGSSTELACSACGILINLSLQVDNQTTLSLIQEIANK